MFVWPHNEIILGPSWELGAYNLQHRGYRGTQVGVGNLDFCNIVGPNWELGIWEFIAKNDIVGGHLGKQKHCSMEQVEEVPLGSFNSPRRNQSLQLTLRSLRSAAYQCFTGSGL